MDNFTVGDRCLVHLLESEAGQPLNGKHVTLADAIIEKGRFKCKFDDGSFACIKPCNLQMIRGDRANQTTEKCETDASSDLNKKKDQTKMEVTTDDDKKETATSTTTTQPQDEKEEPPTTTYQQQQQKVEKGEECPICLDVLPKYSSSFMRADCCGKGMHVKCREDMIASKMSLEQKNRCVMCRTKYPNNRTKEGRKEQIARLRKWAKKGKAWAQSVLGCRYEQGNGVKQDEKRAIVLYNLASEQGYANAQFNLGVMYREGRGVDKDEKHAVELYTLAADQSHPKAQFNLGNMYADGRGVDKDEKRAVEFYTLAADQSHANAQYNLGLMYANGQGVDKDEKRAEELLTLAAEQGHASAQYNLGIMYERGQGVDKDEKRAVEMYTLAADQSHPKAQFNLGCMYFNGKGVDRSLTIAREWWTKAATQGHENAINTLERLDKHEGRTTTPSSTVNSNTTFCSYCNKSEPTNTKFNRCKRCHSVSYCNRECQIKHWKAKPNGHKKQCKKLAAAFKTLKKKKEK